MPVGKLVKILSLLIGFQISFIPVLIKIYDIGQIIEYRFEMDMQKKLYFLSYPQNLDNKELKLTPNMQTIEAEERKARFVTLYCFICQYEIKKKCSNFIYMFKFN